MAFRPETAKPLNDLVDILLRGPHPLSPGERELIAAYVSSLNDCRYCHTIHGARLPPIISVLFAASLSVTFRQGCLISERLGRLALFRCCSEVNVSWFHSDEEFVPFDVAA